MADTSGPPSSRLAAVASRLNPGEALAIVVVAGYLLVLALSAAAAPPIDVGEVSNESDVTVGFQGPFRSAQGYAVVLGPDTKTTWKSPEAWAHFDVDRLENGDILAGFMVRDQSDCGPYDAPCARTGFRIYDTESSEVVREWTMPVRTHVNSEIHDATMLPSGEIAMSDMEHERIVVVDESGDVTWQWNASRFYDAPPDPTRTDWLHINDLDYLGDGRFMVSVRNANQVLVVERGEGVVEVINRDRDDADDADCTGNGQLRDTDGDGDVRCGDPTVMDHQHNPQRYADGAVMVADSENDRIVDLRRDDDGRWRVAWTLEKAGGVPLHWPRDADVLANGNVLVTDSLNDRVFEVARNGTVVWSTSTRPIPYEADYEGREYHGDPNATGAAEAADSGPGGVGGDLAATVPPLKSAYNGVVGALSLPYWFRLSHFLGGLATLLAVVVGLGSSVYNRVL